MVLTATLLALTLAQPKIPPRPATPATAAAAGAVKGTAAVPAPAPEPDLPEWGMALETAIPEGVGLNVMYRPVPFLRLWAGPAWNYAAFGVQGGAGVALANWGVTPVLSVEAGRYFSTDVSQFLTKAGGVPDEMLPLLEKLSVNYAAAMLGLEFGSPRGFSFAFRLGLARLSLKAQGKGTITQDDGNGGQTTIDFQDPRFAATMPALKLSFTYWF